MPRSRRQDSEGAWYHVFARGIARRTVFETPKDIRMFLAFLACAVRRREIEVHAFAILPTHFHLLVRSPSGQLAVAMKRILNAYVRYFNRTRKRDGPLFRARYVALRVTSLKYRECLFPYIDQNAVRARLAADPTAWPYCSASYYVRARRPKWIKTSWVDAQILAAGHATPWDGYLAVFGKHITPAELDLIRHRRQAPPGRADAMDDLVGAAPPAVLAWMRRKAELADGTKPGLRCVDAASVLAAVDEARAAAPEFPCPVPSRLRGGAWLAATAYLLREFAALTTEEVGRRLEIGRHAASLRIALGRRLLADEAFAARVAGIAHRAIQIAFGPQPGPP